MYLAIVIKYRMLASHPIWPFWKHPFAFFKECDSIVVKPRITTSGDVQQSIVDLTKGMSPVPLQHLTVSPPQHGCDQKKEQIQKIQMSSTFSRRFSSYVPSLLHNHRSFVCRVCFRGLFCLRISTPTHKFCYIMKIAACYQCPC